MVNRLALLLPALICLAMLAGAGEYTAGHGAGGTIGGRAWVDTFKLLVQNSATPMVNAAVADSGAGWLQPESWYSGDDGQINEAADGSMVRYGGLQTTNAAAVIYNANGLLSTRAVEQDRATPLYTALFAFNVSGLTSGHRVESAEFFIPIQRFATLDFSNGYIAARLDTVVADYAMTSTVSSVADPCWMNTTFNEVSVDDSQAWVPALTDRDDWGDWGPRSAKNENGYTMVGGNGAAADVDVVRLDVTDAIQHALDFGLIDATGGWVVFVLYTNTPTTVNHSAWGNGIGTAQNPGGSPALSVVTTSSRGSQAWGGTVPLSIVWDDNYPEDPTIYALLDSIGVDFSTASYETSWDARADSLWTANNNGEGFDFIAHSKAHVVLGSLTSGQLDTELDRDWIHDTITNPPDTSLIKNFAWVGGGSPKYSILGMERLVANGYITCRGTGNEWDTLIGEITYPAWDQYVNLLAVQSALGTIVFDATDRAEFDDKFWDYIDTCYTENYRSAAMLYNHGFQTLTATPQRIRWFFENIDASPALSYRPHGWIMNQLLLKPRVPASSVTQANGATVSIETSAAMHDSVGVAWVDRIWVGPK